MTRTIADYRKVTAMKQIVLALTCVLMLAGISSMMRAQSLTFSSSKGQTAERQTKDNGECHAIASQQSGFDPAKAQASQSQQSTGGQGVKGAAKGAAVGATAGAIGGDAGQGASTGAKAGMVAGGVNRRQNRREDKSQKEAAQTTASQGQAAYNKALTSCMQERGYVVK